MSAAADSAPSLRDRPSVKYALALLAVTLLASLLWGFAQRADAAVYYASSSKLGRANLDGTGTNPSFITGLSQVAGVAVNGEYVYWSSNISGAGKGTISRARLDGSGKEVIVTGATNPQAIAIDGTYLYWGNASINTIGRAKLDGTEANQSFITGANGPTGIAVNAEYIYWSNNGGTTIGRASIDGTGANQSFITGANGPLGLAIDAGHIYWTNFGGGGGHSIGRANIDGTGKTVNFITFQEGEVPRGVAVDGTHIYWSFFTLSTGTYGRANLDGTGENKSFITGATAPFGIATDARRGTSTTVACEPGLVGRAKTCTATVTGTEGSTPEQPTGTVKFSTTGTGAFEGGETCTLAAGTAAAESTCTVTYKPAEVGTGKETITANFGGDPTANSGSGTTELTVAVPVLPTDTTVACTPNPVFAESPVSCTATVVDTEVGSPLEQPIGTVTFSTTGTGAFEGGETCTLAAGAAAGESTCSVTYTPTEVGTGKETITADFAGGPTADPSSGTMELTVAASTATTATTVACTPDPVFINSAVSCTATVTGISGAPTVPSGTVTFSTTGTGAFEGGETCTLVPTVGEAAACSVTYKPAGVGTGKETITADFGGSPTAEPSSGSMEITVALLPTTTTVACAPNPVYTNVEASCVATVTDTSGAPTPTGEVTFKAEVGQGFEEGTFPDGKSCTLVGQGASASCQVRYSSNLFGSRPIEAKYGGSPSHQASTGRGSLEILRPHKTKSTLACATDSPAAGAPVACTFTVVDSELAGTAAPWEGPEEGTILLSQEVTPTAPTGTVTFESDSGGSFDPSSCVVTPVDGHSSSCTVTFTAAAKGVVAISAAFDGAPAYLPTSATAALKVVAAPVSTQPLQCQPGFQPTGDPPVCKEPTKAVTTVPPAPKPFSRSRPNIDRKSGTATLPVYAPGPGRVVVRGAGVVKVTKKVMGAGRLRIVVKASGSARRTLRSKGHVSLKVLVTYTPTGGKARTIKVPVRLVLANKSTSRSH